MNKEKKFNYYNSIINVNDPVQVYGLNREALDSCYISSKLECDSKFPPVNIAPDQSSMIEKFQIPEYPRENTLSWVCTLDSSNCDICVETGEATCKNIPNRRVSSIHYGDLGDCMRVCEETNMRNVK